MPKYYCRLELKEVPLPLLGDYLIESSFDSDLIRSRIKSNKIEETDIEKRDIEAIVKQKRDVNRFRAINVEVACGLGDFLLDVASKHPDELFLGIDYALPVVQRAIVKAGETKAANVLFFYGRVEDFFRQFHPCPFIDLMMVNYPDPWPKDRHVKRRILQEKNVRLWTPFLKIGAKLIGVTDVENLHAYHLQELSSIKELENIHLNERQEPHPFYKSSSSFEKKASREGRFPKYFAFQKKF